MALFSKLGANPFFIFWFDRTLTSRMMMRVEKREKLLVLLGLRLINGKSPPNTPANSGSERNAKDMGMRKLGRGGHHVVMIFLDSAPQPFWLQGAHTADKQAKRPRG